MVQRCALFDVLILFLYYLITLYYHYGPSVYNKFIIVIYFMNHITVLSILNKLIKEHCISVCTFKCVLVCVGGLVGWLVFKHPWSIHEYDR